MRSHIIGVAGPSSSGKSELARQLVQRLPGTSIVSLDSYYRGMEDIPLEERKKVNFDHPDSLDWELLHEHLLAIAGGRAFDEPVYSFADYARTAETRRIEPTSFLIVEGLFVLYWPELRAMLDTKVYVQTASRGLLSPPPDARRGGTRTDSRERPRAVRTHRAAQRGVVRLPDRKIRRPGGLRRRAVRTLHQQPSSPRCIAPKPPTPDYFSGLNIRLRNCTTLPLLCCCSAQ